MDHPAMKSKLAERAVLLSVATAGKRLVAVGERGIILLSDDDASSWRQADVPVSVTLTAVRFASQQKGWALGHSGVVLHTKNGGDNWEKQLDGGEAARLILKAAKAKAQSGQCAEQEAKRILNAAQQFVDDGADKPFLDLYCEDEQKVLIVGAYNLSFRTEDGGVSWQPRLDYVDNIRGLHLYGVQPLGEDLFISGEQGLFLRSGDRGETFNALATPYAGSYFGLQPLGKRDLIIFGLRGNVFKSEDRGLIWRTIYIGIPVSITAAAELRDGTLALTTQSGDVLVSSDKGETFGHLKVDQPFPLTGIAQAANGNLVLVGVRGIKVISGALKPVKASDKSDGE
ncbi:MAG: glycosyl hydrolase [Deltaproteobacteria bacterium]|nr:glycosyl hydrolase [Deltaproteobacteria bacterium]